MKKLLCLCAALMMAFTAASAFAASDVTGAWTTNMAGPNGDSMQITFTFKQDGDKLTGTVLGPMGDPMEISEGKVDGDNIAFKVVREFNGNQFVTSYKGTVEGDTMKLDVTRPGRGGGEAMTNSVTAKKSAM